MHLALDGYVADSEMLRDTERIYQFLDSFPERLGMNKLIAPCVIRYDAPNKIDSGVSGFVIIAESHISVHTFSERGFLNIDVFSCKPFDVQRAVLEIREFFRLTKVKEWVLERGLEYLQFDSQSDTEIGDVI